MTALNLQTAQTMIAAALSYARERRFQPLGVAVLDARGALVAYAAEDGTSLRRQDIALAKANAALAMGMGSRAIAARAKAQPVFYAALANVIQGGFAPAPGGVLVRDAEGALLGAIGVSGDVSDNDESAALFGIQEAGLKADPGRE
jgi:uncharacterized protein GlcG (DUF336 family)